MICREVAQSWAQQKSIEIHDFDTIDSTNNFAKKLPWLSQHRLVIADHQTHGRGRGTNTWLDNSDGQQLLSSWVIDLRAPPQPVATPRVGLALWLACKQTWPEAEWSLKAPNDLLLSGRKVAGLLLEVVSQGDMHRLIIGLGFNLASHPQSIPGSASVSQSAPQAIDRLETFLDHWWLHLNDSLPDLVHSQLTPNVCAGLCEALNENPNLKEMYSQVYPDGSLQASHGKIDWLKL